jgi:hypothetical protein
VVEVVVVVKGFGTGVVVVNVGGTIVQGAVVNGFGAGVVVEGFG